MKELNITEIQEVSGGHTKSEGQIVGEAILATAAVIVAGPTIGAFLILGGFIVNNISEV
ncbi:hypothetical protein [Thalassotalea sp. PS06]|uniref:hypothetical protein n=1 Tax=Thalassotalea sp. PS06 TaxID=2594005 RepID=UPI00163DCA6C|nr:hypothetical protein [Thalassotalea sp. PS06]